MELDVLCEICHAELKPCPGTYKSTGIKPCPFGGWLHPVVRLSNGKYTDPHLCPMETDDKETENQNQTGA